LSVISYQFPDARTLFAAQQGKPKLRTENFFVLFPPVNDPPGGWTWREDTGVVVSYQLGVVRGAQELKTDN
ncbi:MAG TPA: hypothetical protein VOA00_02075, partial [Thermoanaerobaculia bacterium]|nr:hypothetical protein [Thermoanaerobaculia bacterium]